MVVPLLTFSQTLKKLDEKNGFKVFKFGLPPDSVDSYLMEISEKGGVKYYSVIDTALLKIGDTKLESITIGFYKNQLTYISIATKGYTNSRSLLDVFKKAYGSGYKSNPYIEDYSWWGKTVGLSYDENSATRDSSSLMYSITICDQKKKDDDEKANKATGDL